MYSTCSLYSLWIYTYKPRSQPQLPIRTQAVEMQHTEKRKQINFEASYNCAPIKDCFRTS